MLLFVVWAVGRRGRRATSPVFVVMGLAIALWFPWAIFTRTYAFYAAPIVPVLAVGVVAMSVEIFPTRLRPLVLGAIEISAGVVFAAQRNGFPWTS